MTFREYYTEHPEFLLEMPSRHGISFGDPMLDNISVNIEDTRANVIPSTPLVDSFELADRRFDLYRDSYEGDSIEDSWVDSVIEAVAVQFTFHKKEGGLQATGVHQLKQYPSLARTLIFDYYLKHFQFLQSDRSHSVQGEKYWKKIIKEASEKDYEVFVATDNEEDVPLGTPEEARNYWSSDTEFSKYQFKIKAK